MRNAFHVCFRAFDNDETVKFSNDLLRQNICHFEIKKSKKFMEAPIPPGDFGAWIFAPSALGPRSKLMPLRSDRKVGVPSPFFPSIPFPCPVLSSSLGIRPLKSAMGPLSRQEGLKSAQTSNFVEADITHFCWKYSSSIQQ